VRRNVVGLRSSARHVRCVDGGECRDVNRRAVLENVEVFSAKPANQPPGLVGDNDVHFHDGGVGLEHGP
jgi:hypothetical protein